jgi:lipopolysaccharide transport system permease protein
LVPILLQLIFLLSPILYKRKNLGSMAWTADFNPIYHILSQVRDTLMLGQVQWATGLVLLLFNLVGIWVALKLLNRERPNLPFLI